MLRCHQRGHVWVVIFFMRMKQGHIQHPWKHPAASSELCLGAQQQKRLENVLLSPFFLAEPTVGSLMSHPQCHGRSSSTRRASPSLGAAGEVAAQHHTQAAGTHRQQGRADGSPAHLPEQPRGEAQHGFHVVGEPLDPCRRMETSLGCSEGAQTLARCSAPSQPHQEPHACPRAPRIPSGV